MIKILFGSNRRGDFDNYSDKDILLIGDHWDGLKEERISLEKSGCSVSCFTSRRAHYLVSTGSLFFKHILDEGALISGPYQEYKNLAIMWKPAASYGEEIDQNLDLLELLAFTPNSYVGLNTATDIVICSIRNILIRRLAQIGRYVFSWENIFLTAVDLGLITNRDVEVFLIARRIKNLYRKGHFTLLKEEFINALMEAAYKVFLMNNVLHFNVRPNISHLPEKCYDGSYKQLRAIELMCAEYEFEPALKQYKSWISNPSYFCNNGLSKLPSHY
jgi:hypothetical protein